MTLISVKIDLSNLSPGEYIVGIRRADAIGPTIRSGSYRYRILADEKSIGT